MNTLGRDGVACAETARPREAHRATSKDVRANGSDTPRQKQRRTAENARSRSTSLSQRALMHAGNLVLIGRKQVFSESDGGVDRGIYGRGYMHDALHWFLHKFKMDLVEDTR